MLLTRLEYLKYQKYCIYDSTCHFQNKSDMTEPYYFVFVCISQLFDWAFRLVCNHFEGGGKGEGVKVKYYK